MTDAEMLERIKRYNRSLKPEEIDWLIGQAGRAQELEYFAQKIGELNVFLQGKVTGRLGESVVYVAMDLIKKQEKENARFRKALEEIAKGAGDYYADDDAQIAIEALAGESK